MWGIPHTFLTFLFPYFKEFDIECKLHYSKHLKIYKKATVWNSNIRTDNLKTLQKLIFLCAVGREYQIHLILIFSWNKKDIRMWFFINMVLLNSFHTVISLNLFLSQYFFNLFDWLDSPVLAYTPFPH